MRQQNTTRLPLDAVTRYTLSDGVEHPIVFGSRALGGESGVEGQSPHGRRPQTSGRALTPSESPVF